MEINAASGVPVWRQLADHIADRVKTGDLAVGDALPSVRELMDTYGVSTTSLTRALAELRSDGLIRTERGRGNFVAEQQMLERTAHRRYAHGASSSPTSAELARRGQFDLTGHASVESASPQVAAQLGIEPGAPVSRIDYLWVDKIGPIQRSTQREPLSLTSGTQIEHPPESGYPDVITRYDSIGMHADRVTEEVRSRMPTAAESEELRIGESVPILYIVRTHFADKVALETAEITIRGDRMAIKMEHPVAGEWE